jgi:hypothetical protein
MLLIYNKTVRGNAVIEIHLDSSITQPRIEKRADGTICLVISSTMPVADALDQCDEQVAQQTRSQFLSLFEARSTPREFELANGFLIIRPAQVL